MAWKHSNVVSPAANGWYADFREKVSGTAMSAKCIESWLVEQREIYCLRRDDLGIKQTKFSLDDWVGKVSA